MELGRRDDFGQFFHVDGFDIEDVWINDDSVSTTRRNLERSQSRREGKGRRTERLIGNVQVPQVDPEVVCAHVRLSVRVDRDRVDVVRVGVGVDFSRHGSDDRVVVSHAG